MERKTNEENYYCNWKMKQENKGERKKHRRENETAGKSET